MTDILTNLFFRRRTRLIEHLHRCERKIEHLSGTIRQMQLEAERKNVKMRAMNLLVACDGPCNRDLMDKPELVTEDVVRDCERIALRLRHWLTRGGVGATEAYRRKWALPPPAKKKETT